MQGAEDLDDELGVWESGRMRENGKKHACEGEDW
jgi:hypothetical protein